MARTVLKVSYVQFCMPYYGGSLPRRRWNYFTLVVQINGIAAWEQHGVDTAEGVAQDLSSLQPQRSVLVTLQASLVEYTCLGLAYSNDSSIRTPLNEGLDLGTEIGQTHRQRGFILVELHDWLSLGISRDTRRRIVDGHAVGAG